MSEKNLRKSKNKGVVAKIDRRENLTEDETSTATLSRCKSRCKSLNKVKADVKTVIELMGPHTPHANNQSSSNMADNEESFFTNTTEKSKTEEIEITENYDTDRTVPPDMTLQEDTDYSIVAARHSVPEQPTNDMPQCAQMICPPPWLRTNVMFGSECVCPQVANYMQNMPSGTVEGQTRQTRIAQTDGNILSTLLKSFKEKCSDYKVNKKCEYYKMNMKQSKSSQGIPKKLVFDLVDDIRQPCGECRCYYNQRNNYFYKEPCNKVSSKTLKEVSNTKLRKEDIRDIFPPIQMKSSNDLYEKSSKTDTERITRVDVYYFDHGHADYLRTTDRPPKISTDKVAERTEAYTTRFWAEIFGTCHIGVSFCTSFILQLFRFILYSFLRPLTIGVLQLSSDYFFKPFLTTVFNSFIQPPLTFLYNVATSVRDLCEPIARAVGFFLKEISGVIRAFRIVEVFQIRCADGNCYSQRTCKENKDQGIA